MMEETMGYHQLSWEGDTPTSDRPEPGYTSQTHYPRDLRLHPTRSCTGPNGHGPAAPSDPCSCIYLSLILCGAAFLLPYNSFITAVDFYQARFPESTIIFDMSLTYICLAFVGVVINNVLVEACSLQTRISVGYILSLSTLILITLLDVAYDLFSPSMSYKITLIAISVVALGCTVQQSSFYGYTSMLPQRYTQAVMTGESAAGLIVSINRIITKLFMKGTQTNTVIFFTISIALIVFCCIAFNLSRRTNFIQFYVGLCETSGLSDDQKGIAQHVTNPEEVSLVDILDGNVTRDKYGVLVMQSPSMSPQEDMTFSGDSVVNYNASTSISFENEVEVAPQGHGRAYRKHLTLWSAVKRGCINRYQVARTVYPYMISICITYFVTLCLFPGIESEITSCDLGSWMPVILIAVFNLFDFIGKIIASVRYDWPALRLVLCTLCRMLLIPLLMLCATPRGAPIIQSEPWPVALSAVLGVTNGYFGSVPMILAPSKVPDYQKELTGNIMTLSYSLGLTLGSAMAYLLDSMLGAHVDHDVCSNATYTDTPLVTTWLDQNVTLAATTMPTTAATTTVVNIVQELTTGLLSTTTTATTTIATTANATLASMASGAVASTTELLSDLVNVTKW